MSDRSTAPASRRAALLLALSLATSSAVALAHPAKTYAWDENAFSSSSASQLVALTNQSRAAAGRKSLKVSSTLASIARWRSKDMIERGYFSHSIPGVGKVFDVMDDKGYCYHLAGENIGWNNEADDVATARIHDAFMNSSSHRSNILNKSWDVIGVGAYQGSDGKKMWTVLFADRAGCGDSSTSTPKPTAKPQPKPKPKPTPRPTPRPTTKPRPTATAEPAPSDEPSDVPATTEPSDGLEDPTGSFPPPEPLPADEPEASDPTGDGDPADGTEASILSGPDDHGRRVMPASTSPGLLDTIVGGVAGFFFGS